MTVHMVETSEDLRAAQVKALRATFAPTASYSASRGGGGGGGTKEVVGSAMQLPGGGEVYWHNKMDEVRREQRSFLLVDRGGMGVSVVCCGGFVGRVLYESPT